ncbi:killer cell lectin-like receptor subfamily G member 1 [Stigmatopora argus]
MNMQKIHTKNIPNKEENADEVNGERNLYLLTEGPFEEAAGPSDYSALEKPPEDIYASISQTKKKAQGTAKSLRILCPILSVICLALLVAIVVVATRKCDRKQWRTFTSQDEDQCKSCPLCPNGWMRLDLSCYYLSTFTLHLDESDVHCKQKGGSLASIYTDDVQNFLSENGKGWTYWFGKKGHGDSLRGGTSGYWGRKQSGGNCVVLNSSERAGSNWMRSSCNPKHFFICEIYF